MELIMHTFTFMYVFSISLPYSLLTFTAKILNFNLLQSSFVPFIPLKMFLLQLSVTPSMPISKALQDLIILAKPVQFTTWSVLKFSSSLACLTLFSSFPSTFYWLLLEFSLQVLPTSTFNVCILYSLHGKSHPASNMARTHIISKSVSSGRISLLKCRLLHLS